MLKYDDVNWGKEKTIIRKRKKYIIKTAKITDKYSLEEGRTLYYYYISLFEDGKQIYFIHKFPNTKHWSVLSDEAVTYAKDYDSFQDAFNVLMGFMKHMFSIGDTVVIKSSGEMGRIIREINKKYEIKPLQYSISIHPPEDLDFKWHIKEGDLIQYKIIDAPYIYIDKKWDNKWGNVLETDAEFIYESVSCNYKTRSGEGTWFISDFHIKKHISGGLQPGDKIILSKKFYECEEGETIEVQSSEIEEGYIVKRLVEGKTYTFRIPKDSEAIGDIIREERGKIKKEEKTPLPSSIISSDTEAVLISFETKNKTDYLRGDSEEIVLIKNRKPDDIKNGGIKVLKVLREKKTKKIIGFETDIEIMGKEKKTETEIEEKEKEGGKKTILFTDLKTGDILIAQKTGSDINITHSREYMVSDARITFAGTGIHGIEIAGDNGVVGIWDMSSTKYAVNKWFKYKSPTGEILDIV